MLVSGGDGGIEESLPRGICNSNGIENVSCMLYSARDNNKRK